MEVTRGGLRGRRGGIAVRRWKHLCGGFPGLCRNTAIFFAWPIGEYGPIFALLYRV